MTLGQRRYATEAFAVRGPTHAKFSCAVASRPVLQFQLNGGGASAEAPPAVGGGAAAAPAPRRPPQWEEGRRQRHPRGEGIAAPPPLGAQGGGRAARPHSMVVRLPISTEKRSPPAPHPTPSDAPLLVHHLRGQAHVRSPSPPMHPSTRACRQTCRARRCGSSSSPRRWSSSGCRRRRRTFAS